MALPGWVTVDLTHLYFAAERVVSPRLEAALRTDLAMDVVTISVGLRRVAGEAASDAVHGLVEALGLPSGRQIRQLQQSIDDLRERA